MGSGTKTLISKTLVGISFSGRQRRLPCLVQFSGPNIGKPFFLKDLETTLGRDPRVEIFVNERKISRYHAVFLRDGDEIVVRDLDSSNGTYLNGQKIKTARLHDGDMVAIGPASFKYFAAGNIEQLFHDRLYRQATIDEKTQVFNDKYLMTTLGTEIEVHRAFKRDLSIIIYDLDFFKKVNDTYGHRFGDRVLKETAAIAAKKIRKNDDLCRYGGEEFVIILRETDKRTAFALAERMRRAFAKHIFTTYYQKKRVQHMQTVSMGVAQLTRRISAAGQLIKAADVKLYQAKKSGRNRVCA